MILFVLFMTHRQYSSLEVAAEYFRSGADKISIGSDAVYAAEEYLKTGVCVHNFLKCQYGLLAYPVTVMKAALFALLFCCPKQSLLCPLQSAS